MVPAGDCALVGSATEVMAGLTMGVEPAAGAVLSIVSRLGALGFSSTGRRLNCWGICSGSGRLLSACGRTGLAEAGWLSNDVCAGLSVVWGLLSSALPHDFRQSLGGAAVIGAGLGAVVLALGGMVIVVDFAGSLRIGVVDMPV